MFDNGGKMENNIYLLESCIKEFQSKNEMNMQKEDEIFEFFCGSIITKEFETDFSEIEEALVDGGLDGGIDSFFILFNEKSILIEDEFSDLKFNENSRVKIILIQSKIPNSFKETSLDKLIASLPIILNLHTSEEELKNRFNDHLAEKILLFRKTWKKSVMKNSKIELVIYYACKADMINVNSAFKSKIEQIKNLLHENMTTANIDFRLLSSKELLEGYNFRRPIEIEMKFKEGPLPVKFSTNEYGYIGTVSLRDFYNLIVDENNEIREEIFETNIRHFQGDVDVNRKIVETLKNDENRDFWWLNNGVTIISNSCQYIPNTLFISDVQIVNGLQTSFSIFNTFANIVQKEKRSIIVKIIVSEDKETIDKVIEATNSQNAVPPVILRATDPLQRLIEKYFIENGFFYDRRKNYYKNQGKPLTKVFTIQDVAQATEALVYKNPSKARRNPTTIIKEEDSYKRIFNEKTNFDIYLKTSRIIRMVKLHINSLEDKTNKNFLKNFSFHIALFTFFKIIKKNNYERNEIINIEYKSYSEEFLKQSIDEFRLLLAEYLEKTKENPINAAKSTNLDKYITAKFNPHDSKN